MRLGERTQGEESLRGCMKVLHRSVLCFGCIWLGGTFSGGGGVGCDVLSKPLATNQLLSI